MSNFSEISYTSTDGLALYARDYAAHSGPARLPVICIHGLTRNSGDFDELAPWIASLGRRVIAVDVRGRGHSARDPDPDHYNPLVYAGDIVKLAHDLGIERAVFVGTSMGGLITMTLALRKLQPDRRRRPQRRRPDPVRKRPGAHRRLCRQACAAWPRGTRPPTTSRNINQSAFPDNGMDEWGKWARRAFAENAQGQLVLRYDPNIAQPHPDRQTASRTSLDGAHGLPAPGAQAPDPAGARRPVRPGRSRAGRLHAARRARPCSTPKCPASAMRRC